MKIVITGDIRKEIKVRGDKDDVTTRDEVISIMNLLDTIFITVFGKRHIDIKDDNEGATSIYR